MSTTLASPCPPAASRGSRTARRRARVRFSDDRGAATAEYAIATMATVAASGQTDLPLRGSPEGRVYVGFVNDQFA